VWFSSQFSSRFSSRSLILSPDSETHRTQQDKKKKKKAQIRSLTFSPGSIAENALWGTRTRPKTPDGLEARRTLRSRAFVAAFGQEGSSRPVKRPPVSPSVDRPRARGYNHDATRVLRIGRDGSVPRQQIGKQACLLHAGCDATAVRREALKASRPSPTGVCVGWLVLVLSRALCAASSCYGRNDVWCVRVEVWCGGPTEMGPVGAGALARRGGE
jgi:hypothetical protein